MPTHPSAVFESEYKSFARFLSGLEQLGAEKKGHVSRWYRGPVLEVYARASKLKPVLRGESAICLANLAVHSQLRGQGAFKGLVCHLDGLADLTARHLYIELPSPRLAQWLRSQNFAQCPYSERDTPSFHRRLAAAHEAKNMLAQTAA